MNINQLLVQVQAILPDVVIDEDASGELIIATGLRSVGDDSTELVPVSEV